MNYRFITIIIYVVSFSSISLVSSENEFKYSYQTKYFKVPVDHFNFENNKTFNIRYLYNNSYVNNSTREFAPLLFYTGNEGDIELFAQNTGFMWELGKQLKAYLVFAEHRYYGESLPFGNSTFNSTSCIGYLSVEQTLEDFASLIYFLNPHGNSPVIAFGGSYGGMLAAWFRMKYPHLVLGALAASAPIWQFNGLTQCDIYAKIVTSVFTAALTSNCSENIKKSWDMFRNFSSTEDGRRQLNSEFKFCEKVDAQNINKFLDYLEDVYGNLAMANYPYENSFITPLPGYPVRQFCLYLKDKMEEKDLLQAMQKAINVYANYTGSATCLDYTSAYAPSLGGLAWDIQTCNQMVMPMCSNVNNTMFRQKNWDFQKYSEECFRKYKILPQLNDIVLRYGGKNLDFVSNIIFSNGLLDPWSGGGVLQTINDKLHVTIIPEGAHHLDLRSSNPLDPPSVQEARANERSIIKHWITTY